MSWHFFWCQDGPKKRPKCGHKSGAHPSLNRQLGQDRPKTLQDPPRTPQEPPKTRKNEFKNRPKRAPGPAKTIPKTIDNKNTRQQHNKTTGQENGKTTGRKRRQAKPSQQDNNKPTKARGGDATQLTVYRRLRVF